MMTVHPNHYHCSHWPQGAIVCHVHQCSDRCYTEASHLGSPIKVGALNTQWTLSPPLGETGKWSFWSQSYGAMLGVGILERRFSYQLQCGCFLARLRYGSFLTHFWISYKWNLSVKAFLFHHLAGVTPSCWLVLRRKGGRGWKVLSTGHCKYQTVNK